MVQMRPQNRVIVVTGDGKGKTTSALGMVLRAVGHGHRVCVIQFIKGRGDTGEARGVAGLAGVEFHVGGEGFVRTKSGDDFERHVRAARCALRLAAEKLRDPSFRLVVLDEICGAVAHGLLSAESVCEALDGAAPDTTVVLTGRDASPELVALADTVSRIDCVKHGYQSGRSAQEGVEF